MQNGSSWQRTSFGTLDESLSGLGHSSIVGSLMLTRPGGRTHNASWIDPRFFEDILLDPIEPKFGLRQSMEEAVAKGCWRTEAERERRAMVWGRDEGEMVLIETRPVFGVIVLYVPATVPTFLSFRATERTTPTPANTEGRRIFLPLFPPPLFGDVRGEAGRKEIRCPQLISGLSL